MVNIHSFLQKMKKISKDKNKALMMTVVVLVTVVALLVRSSVENAAAGEEQADSRRAEIESAEETKGLAYDFAGRYIVFPLELTKNNRVEDNRNDIISELTEEIGTFAAAGAAIDAELLEKSGVEGFAYEDYAETIEVLNDKKLTDSNETAKTTEAAKVNETAKTTETAKTNETVSESADSTLKKVQNDSFVMTLSDKEKEILFRIVEAEATSEDIYGKILVANVVLNRMLDDEFPETVEGVVFQSGQFSPIRDGRYYTVTITEETVEAVERALSGEDYSKGALYFFARKRTTSSKAKWFDTALKKVLKYGGHEFYANK